MRYPEECPECGRLRLWGGQGWLPHTERQHQTVRRALLRTISRIVAQEVRAREIVAQNAAQGCVTIRWKCKSVVTPENEWWSAIPQELWDAIGESGRQGLLRELRSGGAWLVRQRYNIDVNPVTFFHKIYDRAADTVR
jgi:hypothetical protein